MESILLTLVVLTIPQVSNAYTDDQLVMAIYHAEGGATAEYPFGIRSVNCETYDQCKAICKKTIRNNHIRFNRYGHRRFERFIDYLASRYCPTTGSRMSQAERRLNCNWIRNVEDYLKRNYYEKY